MKKVLVHVHITDGPIGVWALIDGRLEHHYSSEFPAHWRHRAEIAIASKGTVPTLAEWFEQLSRLSPYLEAYEVVESPDTEPLSSVLHRLREARL